MTDGWARLGRRIQTERARLGYSSARALAAAAGLSPRTVEVIESGKHTGRPRPGTLAKLERALGWAEGSCERIVEGGRPRPAPDPLLERLLAAWPHLSGDQQAELVRLAEKHARPR